MRQLWRGTLPSALRTGFGSALYFTTLNSLRHKVAQTSLLATGVPVIQTATVGAAGETISAPKSGVLEAGKNASASSSSLPKLSNAGNLLTGAVARTFAGFVMMPITVIKVRYESNLYAYSSMLSASRDIVSTQGLRGFFAGFGATAIRDAPYAGLYVLFYEQSKKRLSALATRVGPLGDTSSTTATLSTSASASVNFTSGIVSSVFSTAITNPFDAIKTRLQLMPGKYRNMAHAAKLMLGQEGVRSLFDGLGLRIGRKALSSALAWTLYEELIKRAERRFG